MRTYTITFFTVVVFLQQINSLVGQIENCADEEIHQEMLRSNEAYSNFRSSVNQQKNISTITGLITIPVVFHLFIQDPAEEVSLARLQSVLSKVTADFRFNNPNVPNIRPEFDGLGADAEIKFCLATQDPKGQPTLGYTKHYYDPTDIWLQNSIRIHTSEMGGQDPWDPDQYLNIYAYNGGGTSYAKRPGTPKHLDGVVLGWRSVFYGGNEIISHEIGHWLDLDHTFWNGCNEPGDGIDDTPPQQQSSSCTSSNTCNTGPLDLPDMNENIMSYGNCRTMFTQGQKVAMRNVLSPGGGRDQIPTSSGCALQSQILSLDNWRIGNCGISTSQNFAQFSNIVNQYGCNSTIQNGAESIWEIRIDAKSRLNIMVDEPSVEIYILDEFTTGDCIYYSNSNTALTPLLESGHYYIVIEDSGNTNGDFNLSVNCLTDVINDHCADAALLEVTESCIFQFDYHNIGAYSSGVACNPINDIWFKFENPASGSVYFNPQYQVNDDYYYWSAKPAFYNNDCNDLQAIFCDDNVGSVPPFAPYIISNLVPGDTSLIQLSGPRDNWRICLSEVPTPPINDECSGAIDLPSGSECNSYIFNHFGATRSILSPDLCTTFTNNNDTWYKTTVPASGNLVIEVGFGFKNYAIGKLFTGTCGNLTNYSCDFTDSRASKPYFNIQDEIPGTEIYILLTSYTGFEFPTGIPYDMGVCVYEPEVVTNETCPLAEALDVTAICQPVHLEVHGASIMYNKNTSCIYPGPSGRKDVWYSFIMPASGNIEISAIGHEYPNRIHYEILSGSCDFLTSLFCANYFGQQENTFTGIPNQLYYLRFGLNAGRSGFGTVPLDIDLCLVEKECIDLNMTVVCNDQDTPGDFDDTFEIAICPESNAGGNTFGISGDISAQNLSYGLSYVFNNNENGFLVSAGAVSFSVTDDDNTSCQFTFSVDESLCMNNCADGFVGEICDDGDECTLISVYDINCDCIGQSIEDSDNDGVCDAYDQCPGINDLLINMPCDDGDICTIGEYYNDQCICTGGIIQDVDNNGICDAQEQDSILAEWCDRELRTIFSFPHDGYYFGQEIYSAGIVNDNVNYIASECVELYPGFETLQNSNFQTLIKDCPTYLINQVVNGGFESGFSNWIYSDLGNSSANSNYSIDLNNVNVNSGNQAMKVEVLSISETSWHIMLRQANITLEEGKTYQLKFWAKADSNRKIGFSAQTNFAPFKNYGLSDELLSSSWKEYSTTFLYADPTLTNTAKIYFTFGYDQGAIYWIDDVKLLSY